jgi:hypothetical protein
MVLFDKLSFSQVVGIFKAFKLYCERSVSKQPLAINTTEETSKSESDMEFSLCDNEKVSVAEEQSKQIPGKGMPR